MIYPPNAGQRDDFFEELVPSAARTTSSQSSLVDLGGPVSGLVIQVAATAASGVSPTLDVDIEDTVDGGTTWTKVIDVNTANITASGTTVKRVNLRADATDTTANAFVGQPSRHVRVKWTIGGTTPSFTFSVKAYGSRS